MKLLKNPWHKTSKNKYLTGVLGGLAYALDIKSWKVRLAFMMLFCYNGFIMSAFYILLALVLSNWKTEIPEDQKEVYD